MYLYFEFQKLKHFFQVTHRNAGISFFKLQGVSDLTNPVVAVKSYQP